MSFDIDFVSLKGRFLSVHLNRKVTFRWVAPRINARSSRPFPVLLMNDGQDFAGLGLEKTLSRAFSSRVQDGFAYVGIETGEMRLQEYGTSSSADFKGRGAKAARYARFLIEEFIPFLKSEFGASPHASEWVYCGMSLGGLSAFDIVIHHPDHFGKVGVFSGSFWWRKKAFVPKDLEDRSRIILDVIGQAPGKPRLKFWFQCGTLDETADRNGNGIIDSIDDTQDVIRELRKKGYTAPGDITYVEVKDGRHDLSTWGSIFPGFLDWAFPESSGKTALKP